MLDQRQRGNKRFQQERFWRYGPNRPKLRPLSHFAAFLRLRQLRPRACITTATWRKLTGIPNHHYGAGSAFGVTLQVKPFSNVSAREDIVVHVVSRTTFTDPSSDVAAQTFNWLRFAVPTLTLPEK
jgi:hypothetical protein